MFKTIKENSTAEVVERKSKFISNVFYVESREEAESLIKQINKKYHDARHNCYAYRIFTKEGIIEKASDDGEPSGTAGAPMLNILSKKELTNILVIVTRYFGGILLGTGGLVKAYSEACSLAIKNSGIIEKKLLNVYKVEINYSDIDKFKYFAKNNNIIILKEEYLENVILEIGINEKEELNKIDEKEKNVRNIQFLKETYM